MTTNTRLNYGTSVIYNGIVGKISSHSITSNVRVTFENDTFENVPKLKLRIVPHNKNALIKYNTKYYLISDIKVRNNEILYTLGYINDKNNPDSKLEIYSTDANIISIDKEIQDRTISYLKFTDRYNSTISYLKKKNNELDFLDYSTLDRDMNNLFVRCKLQMSQLNKIEHTLKKTRDCRLELKNIWENPFDFISEDFQLISYKKAEDICNEYGLNVTFETKLEKWSYDLFLRGKNAFYIPKWMYIQEMQKFCIERQEKPAKWLDYIDKIIIDKLVDGKWYKTKIGRAHV